MFVTSEADRGGLLVSVITGGRPLLKQRTVARFFDQMHAAGVADIVWVANERHAGDLEEDEHEVVTYSDDWAFEYARDHWMSPDTPPEPGGFFGAFPGREAAAREAERRGCWGVLQLDDNIDRIMFVRDTRGGNKIIQDLGGFAFFVDMLTAVSRSTNARTVGAQLSSIPEPEFKIARPGFPYSLFIERVGEGREEWFGPYEDDITHSLQYGDRADGSTAAIVPMIRYHKENTSKTGMRAKYNHERSKMLQRLQPHVAKVGVRSTRSNGQGEARVFHTMPAGAIRNPLAVHDHDLYGAARDALVTAVGQWKVAEREGNRAKALERAAKAAGK
ncbi:hypothetical protein SEA_GINGERBUG_59 [Microbacterium phage Gingerbug]|nr:hypothetical protein SEA_GINGERBUG_59 [Microbacterium phage Gingerbug]